jgi:hypothetical protein
MRTVREYQFVTVTIPKAVRCMIECRLCRLLRRVTAGYSVRGGVGCLQCLSGRLAMRKSSDTVAMVLKSRIVLFG